MAPRILYVVTEDWYFLSHRLPMARAAKDAGYEVHVATRLKDGKAAIEREGFVAHGLSWSRGSLSPWGSFSAMVELRRLLRRLAPGHPAQYLAQAGSARHHREPRALRHRRGQ